MTRPLVVLLPDSVDWILGTWCRRFIDNHSGAIDFLVVPIGELDSNPDFVRSALARCDAAHCLTQWGASRILPLVDLASPHRALLIATVHHIVEPGQVADCLKYDRVLTVCDKYRREVIALGYPEDRVVRISNGVDTNLFSPGPRQAARSRLGIGHDGFVIGFAGKATSDHDGRKGFDRFIDILRRLDTRLNGPVMVLTVGPGWHQRLAGSAFRNIRLMNLGFIADSLMPTFYQALDLYLTTANVEGGPVPVLEAMACGTPAFTTPVGVVPEIIRDGENGVLLPFDDNDYPVGRLLDAIMGRVALSDLGKAARETAEPAFRWERSLANLPRLYAPPSGHPGFGPARNHSPAELTQILWERDSLRWRDQIRAMGEPDRLAHLRRRDPPPASRWEETLAPFMASIAREGTGQFASVPGDFGTLYGTVYGHQTLNFIGVDAAPSDRTRVFLQGCQDRETGYFVGPELKIFAGRPGLLHDADHLILHSTCATLPFCAQHKIPIGPITAAHRYCDLPFLRRWLADRNWQRAWFEGNNILFVGQLLVHLRDVERHPGAAAALALWFDWLDQRVDPKTGLWGTDGLCSPMEAVYGGYHQLLVYYHEDHPLPNLPGLVDTVLALQHRDGGFHPGGNAGACEDVDSVDILVNCYKRRDYRRAEIRHALRRCLRHILSTRNPDGGFPYNRHQQQSHMGIPGTAAGPDTSCTFPTWFRIHTLALIAELLPHEPALEGIPFRFNTALGMGWHASPKGWQPISDAVTLDERLVAMRSEGRRLQDSVRRITRGTSRLAGRLLRAVRKGYSS